MINPNPDIENTMTAQVFDVLRKLEKTLINIKNIFTILTLVTFNATAIDLFKADYKVFKDGKEIGTSSIELIKDESQYKLVDKTTGTHGMASFLGFKRTETTSFSELEGNFIPESYKMKQKVAFKKTNSEYLIDNETKKAKGKHKDKKWQTETPVLFSTPNLVSLNLFRDVCAGKTTELNYQVLKKGEIKIYNFEITTQKNSIIEIDKIHSNPSRITKTWLDTKQQCLPIRTYHIEEGEDSLETKLVQLKIKD